MNIAGFSGAVFGLAGVAGGAVAAHAVKDAHAADMLRTAALYALVHGAVLLCWMETGKTAMLARAFWLLGVLGFSGGLALKYLQGLPVPAPVVPIGGGLMMAGWAAALIRSLLKS